MELITSRKNPLIKRLRALTNDGALRRESGQTVLDGVKLLGEALAAGIQARLNGLSGQELSPLRGDYFMLNCTEYPSVIVECGFLSNAEDEKLLLTEEYRKEVALAVFQGVLAFFA